jgi:hypothetical protein
MTMTEIQNAGITTAPRPAVPIGQAIGQAVGQAEAALSRLLVQVLAETGTTRETYLALQLMPSGPFRRSPPEPGRCAPSVTIASRARTHDHPKICLEAALHPNRPLVI